MKRSTIFIIVVAVAVTIVVGLLLYSKGTAKKGANTQKQSTTLSLPTSVRSATLTGSVLRYADNSSGNLSSLDLDSGKQYEFGPYLIDAEQITWSPDGTKAISISGSDNTAVIISIEEQQKLSGEQGNITNTYGVVTPLDNQVRTPCWSTDGKRILYQFINHSSGTSTITVANADGSNWQDVVAAPHELASLWWSPLGTYAIGLDTTTIPPQYELIAISSKKVTKLTVGLGEVRWSPSGTSALLDSADGQSVFVTNVEKAEVTTLSIPLSVRGAIWQDETHLIAIHDTSIIAIDLASKKTRTIGKVPTTTGEFARTLGVYNDKLLYQDGESVLATPLSNQ